MPVIFGTREIATIGAARTLTITYPTPREDLLEVPITIPTSEPGSPQITWTILEADMPALSGAALTDITPIPAFFVGGTNDTTTPNVHYARLFKNGVEVGFTDRECDGEIFWTYSLYEFAGVAPGDVITLKLWADAEGLTYDYTALAVMVSRPNIAEDGDILFNVAYTGVTQYPSLTLGDPSMYSITNDFLVTSGPFALALAVSGDRTFGVISFDASFAFLFILAFGDPLNVTTSVLALSDTTRPYYATNKVPTAVDWTPSSIRVIS
jgi:hypothetical protein